PEPVPRLRAVAEATLDHPAVEELGRVERPESERPLREAQRLTAAAVPLEGPGQHVVAVDRRTVPICSACELERVRQTDCVVDVEECRLEIRLDAVRDQ